MRDDIVRNDTMHLKIICIIYIFVVTFCVIFCFWNLYHPSRLIDWGKNEVGIHVNGNITERNMKSLEFAVEEWNNQTNATITIYQNSSDIEIYFMNMSLLDDSGIFEEGYDSNTLGVAHFNRNMKKVDIWIDDTSNITESGYRKVILHEISHAMGVPHLGVFNGVMGVSLHDFVGAECNSTVFSKTEKNFIDSIYR